MKNTSKLALFATVVLRALLLVMPVSAALAGDGQEIGETYNNQLYQTEGRVDSAVLAPTGDRLYTLNDGVLRQYNLSPLGRINAMKVAFDSRQTKEDPYKIFITNDEKRIIIYSKKQLRLLDLKTGKIIKTVPFRSELGVLNDDDLFTLDNDNKATVWSVDKLTRKKEFVAAAEEQWSWSNADGLTTNINDGTLVKSANHIILYRPGAYHVNPMVFVFDGTSYRQIWNFDISGGYPSAISYDLNTLYLAHGRFWPLRHNKFVEESGKKIVEAQSRHGAVLKINIATADVEEAVFKEDFRALRYITLAKWAEQQTSPTYQYHLKRASNTGSYAFFYPKRQINMFFQFEDGEAAFMSTAGYFQGTEHARKHLKMKNNKGELVPINDATFKKFNKVNVDHKEW